MIVKEFDTEFVNARKRVSAHIIWENADRREEEIYFEVDRQHSDALSQNIDAFFLATLIPAIHYGEQRYTIEGEVSPELYESIKEALGWISHWYSQHREPLIDMQVQTSTNPTKKKHQRNAGWLMSGGIDSYATFFNNRAVFSAEHPRYIKDGIVAFGLEVADPKKFEYVLSKLKKVAKTLEVTLIPVYTNIYLIYGEVEQRNGHELWKHEFQGAVLASLGHILNNRIDSLYIPSSGSYDSDTPYGTHPLIDPCFSSRNLQINHDGFRFSRFEKTKMIGEHLSSDFFLRVCNDFKKYDETHFNCGQCEKCICTMLGFLALGKLDGLNAFPNNDVTKDMIIENALVWKDDEAPFYRELISPLKKLGRDDLVDGVEQVLKRSKRREIKSNFKSRMKEMDQKLFDGHVLQMKQKLTEGLR
jgi:hypothetical protein